jgi:hypothetical protein
MRGLLKTSADACVGLESDGLVSVEQALAIRLSQAWPLAETELVDQPGATDAFAKFLRGFYLP